MAKHWQPKPDKDCLIDDLNDFLVTFGSSEISKDTNMTIAEIEALLHAFNVSYDKRKREAV